MDYRKYSSTHPMRMSISQLERRIRIESLSDELKRFYVSLQEYEDGQYALFAEPDLIYSNVSTDLGALEVPLSDY